MPVLSRNPAAEPELEILCLVLMWMHGLFCIAPYLRCFLLSTRRIRYVEALPGEARAAKCNTTASIDSYLNSESKAIYTSVFVLQAVHVSLCAGFAEPRWKALLPQHNQHYYCTTAVIVLTHHFNPKP